MDMMNDGFDQVLTVQNKSGHGIDVVGLNSKTGEVKFLEVKATEMTTSPPLSKAQKNLGGAGFTTDRLTRAVNGKGNYGKVPAVMENANDILDWLKQAKAKGAPVSHEKRDVFLDDIEKGCAKHPSRPSKSSPW